MHNTVPLRWQRPLRSCACPDGSIRSLATIKAGEEVTISYVADLSASVSDRADALRHHGFAPERRACDSALEAWTVTASARDDKVAAIGARNAAADAAWMRANAATDAATRKRELMSSASHYAELLRLATNALHPEHELCTHARARLAHVMTESGAQRSCANALPLWRSVIAALEKCVPHASPQLLPPLRGALKAASIAGEDAEADKYKQRLDHTLAVLCMGCHDLSTIKFG
uniref:SET domain-containing protein n=1 Tax=Chrysotila carterae TaxID=13221 RepID=A0A7S4FD62_CHRCT